MHRFLLVAIFAMGLLAPTRADEKKDAPKLPDLNAKEWKELKDADGLKFWDVKEGKGDAVPAGAIVTIHYTGWLTDGTVFDSSVTRGQKATFPLANLIKGWQKGIPGMKPGGVRRLHIPWKLAYGENGRPPRIPAKADLIFEIELFSSLGLPAVDAKEWKELKDTGGLKVWDVKEGKGDETKAGATVTIHYTGWTLDGKVFDSSVTRGEKATFPLGDLIPGWQKGIPGMKPGGVRRLYIPWKLAYGEVGSPPKIPAKADLVFEIEMFESK